MPYEPWQPGMRITADRLRSISPTWSSWTPVWTTSSGASTPSFGNAVVTALFAQSAHVVWYRLEIGFGSTTNFGGGGSSDNWRVSLPVPAADLALISGMGEIQGSSGAERMPVRARIGTTTTLELELSGRNYNNTANASSGLVDATTPWTWATGYGIRLTGQYEAAT
ncbi:hypothetical protein GT204_07920 [Streptomyces sp. SID4919]|uniref:hypothetical protein n=1 Tax=unclassified Streptomyces TaxID=2593676 RepID=UPI000823DEF9|nr:MULTISPECIES: hypothetical protein [unclassified Streptomyces]MYY08832.1 hypothetical protein [Streptomyces sp. SID4919]SCK25639.1 hypothetical protein YW7DRAFT_01968 [Streptomyces sp. AmelKG-E11A]